MALGVLAYPEIKEDDYRLIQNFRKEFDELYYSVVRPHFAFVFPLDGVDRQTFTDEILKKAKGFKVIDFELKCATINKDAILDYYHLLLVPEKGFSSVVKLHDMLYSDLLFSHLRLDIDFIPHVGIANSKDPYKVKNWVDTWNKMEFSVAGTIEKLTIVDYTNSVLTDLMDVRLG
jgi:hypothetical protein